MTDMLHNLKQAILNSIVVKNEYLPPEFHDNREGGRSLGRLEELCEMKEETLTPHQQDKLSKAERIERYSLNAAAGEPIEYDVNEDKLYRNQQAFVGGMVNSGMIDEEDLEG